MMKRLAVFITLLMVITFSFAKESADKNMKKVVKEKGFYSVLIEESKNKNKILKDALKLSKKFSLPVFIQVDEKKKDFRIYVGKFENPKKAESLKTKLKGLKVGFVKESQIFPIKSKYFKEVIKDKNKKVIKIYSVLYDELPDKNKSKKIKKILEKKYHLPVFIVESIKNMKLYYRIYIGKFATKKEAVQFAKKLSKSRVDLITEKEIASEKVGDKTIFYKIEAKGSLNPAVPNKVSPTGTPKNRRVEVTIVALSSSKTVKVVDLDKIIPKGLYKLNFSMSNIYPLDRVYDLSVFMKIPEGFKLISNSYQLNGKKVEVKQRGDIVVLRVPSLRTEENINFSLKFIAKNEVKVEKIPYVVLFKTPKGKLKNITNNPKLLKTALNLYLKTPSPKDTNRLEIEALKKKVKYGIVYPDIDIVTMDRSVKLEIVVPINASYQLLENGKSVSKDLIAETSKDKQLGIKKIVYLSVPLTQKENIFSLKLNGKLLDTRKVVLSDGIADFRFSIFPKEPPADGKTPVYVVLQSVDENGNPVNIDSFVEVRVDKGDIFDYRTGLYKTFVNDTYKVKMVDGKAIIKLSPSTKIEERRLFAKFGNIEREYVIQFYQEKRPWIVLGNIEGAVGLSETKNNPPKITDMPFDHSKDGVHLKGRAAFFAKGSVKDYTVTMRYDSRKESYKTLMEQNIPSTEENQFYPVYGDDSEQYFEAPTKNNIYVRIDKGLSYLLYGDFNIQIGTEFEFNRYTRTFNGLVWNLEHKKDFKVRTFVTKTKQDIFQERIEGKGLSGPYFLKNKNLIQFSEKVWIEVRDRYNPDIILEKKQLNRFTDYTVNYEEGWLIFKEPVPQFDKNLNPIYIFVIYEAETFSSGEYMYGLRGEKWFKDVRIGITGINEDHSIKNKNLYGIDIYYQKGSITALAEFAHSEGYLDTSLNPTSGNAGKAEISYSYKDINSKLYYKQVEDGFQNPSSTTAEERYTTYGFNISKNMKKTNITLNGLVDDRASNNRKEIDFTISREISENLSFNIGGRYNNERRTSDSDEYFQAIIGGQWNPNERLSISLRREQSLSSGVGSTFFPTRTIGKLNYQWLPNVNTFIQTEVQEREDKDVSLTTFGMESQLNEDTTAFTKYTLDDSVSGWRTQSHIGLNHVFQIREGFAIDLGGEDVRSLSGDKDKDYTALRMRAVYTQSERYKMSGSYEVRLSEKQKPQHYLNIGGALKYNEQYTILVRERYFLSDFKENDLLFGFAKRPVYDDMFNYLIKLRWKISDMTDYVNKYIASWHLNYQPKSSLQLMGEIAFKYTDTKDVGTSFAHLYRGRLIYDWTDRLDTGIQLGVFKENESKTSSYTVGAEVGYMLISNLWLSVGYNFDGFYDEDFDDANYWAKGFYFKFRLKFDEDSIRSLTNRYAKRKSR